MESLLLLGLAIWAAVRYGVFEATAAARGTPSQRAAERRQRAAQAHERAMARDAQRHERAMAKISRRQGPTVAEAIAQRIADRIANPPSKRLGPARQFLGEWWADSWAYAIERRRRRHQRAANGELLRQRAARAAKHWVARKLRGHARPASTQRGSEQTATTDRPAEQPQQTGKAQQARPAGEQSRAEGGAPRTGASAPPPRSEGSSQPNQPPQAKDVKQGDDQPRRVWVDAQVVSTEPNVDAEIVDELPKQREPRAIEAGSRASSATAPKPPGGTPGQHHSNTTESQRLASVTSIRKDPFVSNTDVHQVASGETLDPAAALAFVNGMNELAQQMFSQTELSVSNLSQRGVSGEPIDLLEQMKEAIQTVSGSCEAAREYFERHLATQDVVLSDDTLAGTVDGTYMGSRS